MHTAYTAHFTIQDIQPQNQTVTVPPRKGLLAVILIFTTPYLSIFPLYLSQGLIKISNPPGSPRKQHGICVVGEDEHCPSAR